MAPRQVTACPASRDGLPVQLQGRTEGLLQKHTWLVNTQIPLCIEQLHETPPQLAYTGGPGGEPRSPSGEGRAGGGQTQENPTPS